MILIYSYQFKNFFRIYLILFFCSFFFLILSKDLDEKKNKSQFNFLKKNSDLFSDNLFFNEKKILVPQVEDAIHTKMYTIENLYESRLNLRTIYGYRDSDIVDSFLVE